MSTAAITENIRLGWKQRAVTNLLVQLRAAVTLLIGQWLNEKLLKIFIITSGLSYKDILVSCTISLYIQTLIILV